MTESKKKRIRIIVLIAAVVFAAAAVGIVIIMNREEKMEDEQLIAPYTVIHDETAKTISFRGDNYIAEIDYRGQFRISSYRVRKEGTDSFSGNLLAPDRGIYLTASEIADGNEGMAVQSSLLLQTDPSVEIADRTVTLRFDCGRIRYTAVLTLENGQIQADFQRTFLSDMAITQQGFPSVNWEERAIENIRWNRSGANFWVGGKAESFTNFLAGGTGYSSTADDNEDDNVVRGMEDITFSVLAEDIAVSFTGEVFDRDHERPFLTEVQRYENPETEKRHLEMDVSISSPDRRLTYASGTSDGWPNGAGGMGGRVGKQGTDLLRSYRVTEGQTDRIHFTIAARSFDSYYDLGDLKGVDEALISYALNNYGRLMIMDWNMGTTVENPNVFFELPALEQHWNTNIIGILRDDNAMRAQLSGLRLIKDRLQARDGHICSPYVGMGLADSWGSKYSDMQLGYAIAVCEAYYLTGDRTFLEEMYPSAEMALAYTYEAYVDPETCVIRNLNDWDFVSKFNIPANDYWEHGGGKYNGYSTALYYDALCRMAVLAREVMGDETKARAYETLAARVRKSFNEIFWSEKTQTYLYGTGTCDICYLPVQGAAMKTDLVPADRVRQIVGTIEQEHAVFDLPFHVMNIRDILNPKEAVPQISDFGTTMMGMNGGWYGAPDGDYYAGLPTYGDRTLIPRYIQGFAECFAQTGFIGASTYFRDGVTPADYGWMDCMPTFVNVVWGLYTYGYGFQTAHDRLTIAPFLDQSMEDSLVKYRWRGTDLSVHYHTIYSYTLEIAQLPTEIVFAFINQTPGKTYTVRINGTERQITADGSGVVTVPVEQAGTTSVELVNPDPENDKTEIGNLALNKPAAPSSTAYESVMDYWPTLLTDGAVSEHAYWKPDEKDEAPSVRIALGRSYPLQQLRMHTEQAGTYYYVVEGTNDPLLKEWVRLADRSSGGAAADGSGWITEAVSGDYAYVRICFTLKGDVKTLRLSEIEIY